MSRGWVKSLENGCLEMVRRVASFRSYILMIGSSTRIEALMALHLVRVTMLLQGSLTGLNGFITEMLEPKDGETD